ncbi:putative methionine biosynthesis MetW [Fadolivirus algeromassiliense]|jgi:2-polyprenyl-3-methyl-5-hydroxy-6-metoxy-1,4-benzoquinol methylase|uniref:Methionine biosynthesis MetW n=1 Tax=Fadolivirus FV1/VV64 TaxID=3070911 RepID=A0A7D3V7Y2_9VIRU|nr:putative methionine biosynthesis MetW [Fadolivirus algeromassiliense]QKF94676.1 putative methionine biosynthesis MetW [Fadolivirus FV1/VV64]
MKLSTYIVLFIIFLLILIYTFDYQIKKFMMKRQFVKKHLIKTQCSKAEKYSEIIVKYIPQGSKVLDFGTATGCMTKTLREKYNYEVYPLDVINQSIIESVTPQLYQCNKTTCKIPHADKFFDCAIVLGVLHHTHDPYHILEELKRTCKRIIICEDIYYNTYQKYKTYIMDSIVNFEFKGHPHNNFDDTEWKNAFKSLDLKLVASEYMDYSYFNHAIYVLDALN